MKIEIKMKQGILVVYLEGEFDMHSAKEFRDEVDKALDISGAQKILLDFKNVSFIDSSGIGVILGRYKRLTANSGEMIAVNLTPKIKKIFQLSGILGIMKVLDCQEEAFLE